MDKSIYAIGERYERIHSVLLGPADFDINKTLHDFKSSYCDYPYELTEKFIEHLINNHGFEKAKYTHCETGV